MWFPLPASCSVLPGFWRSRRETTTTSGPTKFEVQVMAQFDNHNSQVWRVSWNITSTLLASSGDDGCVRLWKGQGSAETAGKHHCIVFSLVVFFLGWFCILEKVKSGSGVVTNRPFCKVVTKARSNSLSSSHLKCLMWLLSIWLK